MVDALKVVQKIGAMREVTLASGGKRGKTGRGDSYYSNGSCYDAETICFRFKRTFWPHSFLVRRADGSTLFLMLWDLLLNLYFVYKTFWNCFFDFNLRAFSTVP